MLRPALLALLLLAPLALAGCIEVPDAAIAEASQVIVRERYLTGDLGFSASAPREAMVETGAFYQRWANGDDYATWTGDVAPLDLLVTDVRVDLVVHASGPVVESSRFPDLMVYVGAGDAFLGYGEVRSISVLLPGAAQRFRLDIDVPEGGLWVPAGEPLTVKVVPVMMQQEDGVELHVVTGAAGSKVTWTQAPLGAAPRPLVVGEEAGELVGSAYAGSAAPEGTSRVTRIVVPADAQAVVAWMNVTAHEGIPDVDLAIVGPDGETVAFSGTPTPREALKLAAPNLRGPGEYQLVVTSYGSARAAFTLAWAIG